jgi:hypothetical protein
MRWGRSLVYLTPAVASRQWRSGVPASLSADSAIAQGFRWRQGPVDVDRSSVHSVLHARQRQPAIVGPPARRAHVQPHDAAKACAGGGTHEYGTRRSGHGEEHVRGRARDVVEEASADSFPANDPPAWIALNAGSPAPVAKRCDPTGIEGARPGLTRAREPVTDSRHSIRHVGRSHCGSGRPVV